MTGAPTTWGTWAYNPETFVLENDEQDYEIDLDKCTNSAEILDFLFQVALKEWGQAVTCDFDRCLAEHLETPGELLLVWATQDRGSSACGDSEWIRRSAEASLNATPSVRPRGDCSRGTECGRGSRPRLDESWAGYPPPTHLRRPPGPVAGPSESTLRYLGVGISAVGYGAAICGGIMLYRNSPPNRAFGTIPVVYDQAEAAQFDRDEQRRIKKNAKGMKLGFLLVTCGAVLQLMGTILATFSN